MGKPKTPKRNSLGNDGAQTPIKTEGGNYIPLSNKKNQLKMNGKTPNKSPGQNKQKTPKQNNNTPKQNKQQTPKQNNNTPKQNKQQTPKGNANTPGLKSPNSPNKRKLVANDDSSPNTKKQKLQMFSGTAALDADIKVENASDDAITPTKNVKQTASDSKPAPNVALKAGELVINFKRMRETLQKSGPKADILIKKLKATVEGSIDNDPELKVTKKHLHKLLRLHPLTKTMAVLQPKQNPSQKQKKQKNNENKGVKKEKKAKPAQQLNLENAKSKKKEKRNVQVTPKMEVNEETSDESDYNAESSIKVDKITKMMNEGDDSDDAIDSDDDDGDEQIDSDGQVVHKDDTEEDESGPDDDDSAEESEVDEMDGEGSDSDDKAELKVKVEKKIAKKLPKKEKKRGKQTGGAEGETVEKDGAQKQKNKNKRKGEKPTKESIAATLDAQGISQKGQSRYVAFAGNLPYTVSKEVIVEHFSKAAPVKHIRLPTDKVTHKPRGFAFVEFNNSDDYQKALSLHNTFIEGRKINVLYTQGGKKKSNSQKGHIKAKNMKLKAMREKGMLTGSVKESQKRAARRNKKIKLEAKKKEGSA